MILAAVLVLAAAPGAEVAVVRGGITPRVVCAVDPRYSYALYLPKDYAPGRPWPLLYIFDPRGRGAFAADLFADAAAAHGFVIASSNDTRSDDPTAPNAAAVTAMWVDTHGRIDIDPKRLYAAGFSGTARLAVRLGLTQRGAVAGAIAAGGRLGEDAASKQAWPFALWGATGDEDFNNPEMWRLDDQLAANRTPHRIVAFPGGHQWMPKPLAMEAFDWLAIRGGGGPPAPAVLERYASAVGARARALEEAGRAGEALRVWQGLVEDLAAAGGSPSAAVEVKRLGPAAARDLERVRKLTARDREWITTSNQTVLSLAQDPPPALPRLLLDFQVEALRKESRSADRVQALSASRRLSAVETNVGYYLPERFKSEGLLVNAIRSYELAAAIDPDSPAPHLGLARVYARSGNRKAAFDALRTAVARGVRLPRRELAEDPELATLAADPAFEEILKELPAS